MNIPTLPPRAEVELCKIIHLLMDTHPDKGLVDRIHRVVKASPAHDAYLQALWESIPTPTAASCGSGQGPTRG